MVNASLQSPPAPGTRVEVRGEQWLVRQIGPGRAGGWSIHCVGITGIVKDHEAIFLKFIDEIKEVRAEDTVLVRDFSPGYAKSKLYIEALLRRTPPTDDLIHMGHLGAFDHAPYQLKPAELALKSLRPSILIADGVGIGKTVEAGMLLTELIKRGRGERVLVLALKSVLEQFQREFWTRFSIPLVRLDSEYIGRLKKKIPASKNPFHVYNRCIVSVDTLKNDGRYRTYLEQCHWDVVIIDECHKLANESSMRGRLADLLSSRTDSMILTSATPHNGKPESFARLMNMLDPTAVADEKNYTKDEIEGLFVRRFKKDIAGGSAFTEREVTADPVEATQAETEVLRYIKKLRFNTLDEKKKSKDIFFRFTLMKAFLSSPDALLETIDNRLTKLAAAIQSSKGNAAGLQSDQAALEELRSYAVPLTGQPSTKTAALIAHLKKIGVGPKSTERVIIFAERRQTLDALKSHLGEALKMKADQIQVFHAGLGDQEQMDAIDVFGREDAPVRILIAGDVASEGVNLHFYCNHLVHFDIPWSLILLEQRNGRIDRYGQSKTPFIKYLLTVTNDATVDSDLRIYRKLIEKEEYAQKNLGDAGALLGLYDPGMEEDEIQARLSMDQELPELPVIDDEGFDFLALMGNASDIQPESQPKPQITVFENDLQFFKEAIHETAEIEKLITEQEGEFLALKPPKELLSILGARLPNEALPTGGEYLLTTNRKDVMTHIQKARQIGKGDNVRSWPQLQLLWENHPIFQWAIDKTLVNFGKNEAPVLSLRGLGSQTAYVFQATIANPRGQVGLNQWFVVEPVGGTWNVRSWEEVIDSTSFRKPISNSKSDVDITSIQKLLPEAVKEAKRHCAEIRATHIAENTARTDEATKRITKWRDNSLRILSALESSYRSGGSITRVRQEALAHRRKQVNDKFQAHTNFVRDTLGLIEYPSLRVVAVLVENS